MSTERRYTLEEAQTELRRRKCLEDGHRYEVVGYGSVAGHSYPERVFCTRCERYWRLRPGTGGICLGEVVNGHEKWDL